MTKIRIDTQQVRSVANEISTKSNQLGDIGHELQQAIASLDTWAWDGQSRRRAEPMLGRVHPESKRVAQEMDDLARKLTRVADVFEQEDNTAASNLSGMPWVDFDIGGDGLLVTTTAGIATASLSTLPETGISNEIQYDRLEPTEQRIEDLEQELAELRDLMERTLPDDITLEKIEQRIEDIEGQLESVNFNIESVQKALESARMAKNNWGNKLFGLSDDWALEEQYWENELERLLAEKAELEGVKAELESWQSLIEQEANLEQQLNAAWDDVQKHGYNIDLTGVEMRGRDDFIGCTSWAATRYPGVETKWGGAGNWYKSALGANHQPITTPQPGALIAQDGHVMIVEKVSPNGDMMVTSEGLQTHPKTGEKSSWGEYYNFDGAMNQPSYRVWVKVGEPNVWRSAEGQSASGRVGNTDFQFIAPPAS